MAKKSIVKSVIFVKTWKNKEGNVFYSYDVEMKNGDKGEYSSISDSQDKFVFGKEVEYNYTEGEYPKIKPHYSNPSSPNYTYPVSSFTSKPESTDNQIARSVGIKAAVELGIAQGLELADILETAKIMADFITKEKVIEVSKESEKMPF